MLHYFLKALAWHFDAVIWSPSSKAVDFQTQFSSSNSTRKFEWKKYIIGCTYPIISVPSSVMQRFFVKTWLIYFYLSLYQSVFLANKLEGRWVVCRSINWCQFSGLFFATRIKQSKNNSILWHSDYVPMYLC